MKRKKLLLGLLATTMVFSVVGCGGNEEIVTEPVPVPEPDEKEIKDAEKEEEKKDTESEGNYPDLGGATIKVYNTMTGLNESVDPNAENYNAVAADVKAMVEERYNCILEPVKLEGADGINDAELMISNMSSGAPFADIVRLDNVTIIPLVINNLLEDLTGKTGNLQIPQGYIEEATFNGKVYGYCPDTPNTDVLAYDRDFFEEIGMEKTPTDMFLEGKWDYPAFKEYLIELKSKLPEGMYPIGYYPFHWAWAASAANGVSLVDEDMQVNYTDPATIEAVTFWTELVNEGLAAPPVIGTNEDGDTTYSYAYQYNDPTLAMGRMEAWQMGGEGKNFGITLMPWGSNVVIETDGDYTSLSENYQTGRVWISIFSVLKNPPSGVSPEILMQVQADYEKEYGGLLYSEWEKEQAGEYIYGSPDAGTARNFKTEQDMELYDWATTRNRTEWAWIMSGADLFNPWKPFSDIYGKGLDARATLESYEQEAKAAMNEAGFVQKE